MRTQIVLFLLVVLPKFGFSQKISSSEFTTESARSITNVFDNGFDIVPYNLRDNAIKGSAMLLSYWIPGSILLVGNKRAIQVPIKYDLYRQQLRVLRAKGDSIVVPLTNIQEFTLTVPNTGGGQSLRRFVHYEKASALPELDGTCAEIIGGGEHLQLLKFWHKNIVKSSESSTNMAVSNTVQEFSDNIKYCLRWGYDGHLIILRLKKSSIKEALVTQPEALKVLEARKGGLSSEAEVAAAVTAIDPVLTSAPGH